MALLPNQTVSSYCYILIDTLTEKSTPLTISRDEPIVHMAAIMPNAENRDKFILIEKCWTDQQVLLQDFGCSKSELRKVIDPTQSHLIHLDRIVYPG